ESTMYKAAAPPPPPPPPPPAPGGVSATVEVEAAPGGLSTQPGTNEFTRLDLYGKLFKPPAVEVTSKAVGDFFEYDLKGKVTIGKNQSALVPILQTRIDAEKVTIWNQGSREPLRALWLNNSSGVEFDAGSFNILDDGTFAGEGMIDVVRPGEKRLISYAADSAVRIKMDEQSSEKPYSRVVIA